MHRVNYTTKFKLKLKFVDKIIKCGGRIHVIDKISLFGNLYLDTLLGVLQSCKEKGTWTMSIASCLLPPEIEEDEKTTPMPLLLRFRERIVADPQCATMYQTGSVTQQPGGQVMDWSYDRD